MHASQERLFRETDEDFRETLDEINHDLIRQMTRVPRFARHKLILGAGPVDSKLVVVGESPGPPDARLGEPFQGPVGKMLDRILCSVRLKREQCYLTNTVKIITSASEITPEVLSFFTPFLFRELDTLRPKVIVACGNTPARTILKTDRSISTLRGRFYEYGHVMVMPTFNPAYLLRDPVRKREAWEDLKQVREFLETQ